MIIHMSPVDRTAITRKLNINRDIRELCLSNKEMNDLILDLYGLRQVGEIWDLTFEVEDDKKYLMYVLMR